MSNRGLLIVISGPSGAGKGTICRELMSQKIKNLELSVSATTRAPRWGEIDGVSYYFLQKDEFIKMIDNNEFIEYARNYDNYYGTPKKFVEEKLLEGKDVILEIDVQGAMKVKEAFEDAVFIFIIPPSMAELKHRITCRGTESEQDIAKRMKNAYCEVCTARYYDYIVVNDDIAVAAEKVKCIIAAEKCRLKRTNIDFDGYKEE